MTRFTDSPYERMMTRRPEGGKETYPKATPVMAAGIMGSPAWESAIVRWNDGSKKGNEKNEYSDYIYQAACGF